MSGKYSDKDVITTEVTAAKYPEGQIALRKAKDGDPEAMDKWLREHFQSGPIHIVGTTLKRQLRANAKKPRPDALQASIVEIMTPNTAMTPVELLGELRKRENLGRVVYEITNTEICFYAGEYSVKGVNSTKEAKTSGLKDRMCRARRTIASR